MTPPTLHKLHTRWLQRSGAVALAEARAALAARHQDLRKMAHDLRNPLNSILLMAQLLEETGGTPEAARISRRIQKQCSEMNKLVDKALENVPE